MSYASVAAQNAPPPSQQPHPDMGLLNTDAPADSVGVADDRFKVNVVGPDFKKNPTTVTSELDIESASEDDVPGVGPSGTTKRKSKAKARNMKAKAKQELGKAEEEAVYLWEVTKEQLLRPGVAGGLMGIVNVGLLSWASYALYTRPALRYDTRFLASGAAGALVLLGAEGIAAERYAETPRGQEEKRRAKKEGAALYRQTREIVLRPGVLGGLVGVLNLGVLGTVGYFGYTNWDKPTWDRRTVSAITIGLVSLWGGEGILAEKYSEHRR